MQVTPGPCLEYEGGFTRAQVFLLKSYSSRLIRWCPSFWSFIQVALIQGQFWPPGVTWQCLEAFLVITLREVATGL